MCRYRKHQFIAFGDGEILRDKWLHVRSRGNVAEDATIRNVEPSFDGMIDVGTNAVAYEINRKYC